MAVACASAARGISAATRFRILYGNATGRNSRYELFSVEQLLNAKSFHGVCLSKANRLDRRCLFNQLHLTKPHSFAMSISQNAGEDVTKLSAGDGPSLTGYLPEPPSPIIDESSLTEVLTSLGEPTLASLGLCHYTPAGLVQKLLEMMHVYFDIPWFGSLMCLTLCIRLAAIPLTVMQLRNAALMSNHLPTLQRLQQRQLEAIRSRDAGRILRENEEVTNYMNRNNVNPLKLLARSMFMAPIFFSIFYGVRGMALLPVESLRVGGCFWFPDLTIADPYFILPAVSACTIFLVLKTGAEGASLDGLPKGMKVAMKLMPVLVFGFTATQPAALAFYWTVSNMISLLLGAMFRNKELRRKFNIPETIKHPQEDKPVAKQSFSEAFREYNKSMQLMHEIEDRRKVNALSFKKTISDKYDPTSQVDNAAQEQSTKDDDKASKKTE